MTDAATTAARATATTDRPRATSSPTRWQGPTFARVLAAEWTKLMSLRSTRWVALVAVVLTWVITYLSANASSGDPGFDPLASLPDGVALSQLAFLVLGVLVGTGEFRTGAFRTTFTAVPGRTLVLVAQTAVVAVVAGILALVCVLGLVLGVLPAARSRGIALDLTSEGTPQVLLGCGLLLLGMALLGLALGVLLRRTVPALTLALALVFVVPVGLSLGADLASPPTPGYSPESEADAGSATEPDALDAVATVVAVLPGDAAFRMTTSPGDGAPDGAPVLGPVDGGLVLAGWILVPLLAAGIRLRTRDLG